VIPAKKYNFEKNRGQVWTLKLAVPFLRVEGQMKSHKKCSLINFGPTVFSTKILIHANREILLYGEILLPSDFLKSLSASLMRIVAD
jgi:hypothetical protein